MRKFNYDSVRRLVNEGGNFQYSPFPGSNPVHMLIRISLYRPAMDKNVAVHFYNGKWSYSAYRQALRVWNSFSENPLLRSCTVVEYCPTGVLYTGDLSHGTHHRLRSSVFYSKDTPHMRFDRRQNYFIKPVVPVRVNGRSFFSFDTPPDSQDSAAWMQLKADCLNNFKRGLGGLHRAITRNAPETV